MKATLKEGYKTLMIEFDIINDNKIEVRYIGPADSKTIRQEKNLPQMKLITGKGDVLKSVLIREKYVAFRSLSISDSIEYSVKNPRSIYNYIKDS